MQDIVIKLTSLTMALQVTAPVRVLEVDVHEETVVLNLTAVQRIRLTANGINWKVKG